MRNSADLRSDCSDAVEMAADGCGNYHISFCGNCRHYCRGLSWVAMVGAAEFATDRTAVRAVATTVAFAVEVPWAVALVVETRGFPR